MIRMDGGIMYLRGKPQFFLSSDYPYYRDSVEHWSDRLDRLKKCHVNVISFYVPWRHHHIGSTVDFDGILSPNKNVKQLFDSVRKKVFLYC
jgi:beta-galactosidase